MTKYDKIILQFEPEISESSLIPLWKALYALLYHMD